MNIKCLGEVTIEGGPILVQIVYKDNRDGNVSKGRTSKLGDEPFHFRLGKDRYVPLLKEGKMDKSEEVFRHIYKKSKEEPQAVGKVEKSVDLYSDKPIEMGTTNRLWLYDERIYITDRNDYGKERTFLLIRDFIDKEESYFDKLSKKFKK